MVTLDGTGSSDADDDPLTYLWTPPSGTSVQLSSTTAARPTFTAPDVTATEALVFSLIVNDGTVDSVASTVTVTVEPETVEPPPPGGSGTASDPYLLPDPVAVSAQDIFGQLRGTGRFDSAASATYFRFTVPIDRAGEWTIAIDGTPNSRLDWDLRGDGSLRGLSGNADESDEVTLTAGQVYNFRVYPHSSTARSRLTAMTLTLTAPASTGPVFAVDTLDAVTWIDDVAITGFTVPEALGGSAPLSYTASGLPAGVTMSSAREISGTPTGTGTGIATITVTDNDNDTDTLTFDWTVVDDSMPSFDSATIPDQIWVAGEEIEPFTAPLATSGNGDLKYGVNNLPPGVIMLDTRRFQGQPTGAGSGTATLAAIDANGDIATLTFNWTVTAQLSFGSASIAAQTWTAGQAIAAVAVPAASGGTVTLRYEAEGLPSGISLTRARQISGRPLTNGSGTAKVKAIDASGNVATLMFQWTVADPNSPSTGAVLSASANPSTSSDYTISGNYTGTRDYLTWELHESDTRGNDWVYPVSPSTFTQNIVGRTNGRYTYRLEGCYLERHPMYQEAVELCGSVGDSLTVTVNGPAPDSVATQLDYTFQVRSGTIGTNGPMALFIDRTSTATGAGVFQDVILKQVGGGFELVAPASEPTVMPSGWTVATGVELVVDDINLDGFVDIVVQGLGASTGPFPRSYDQIVFAPGHKGGALGTLRAVDSSLTNFLSELSSWTRDPTYFQQQTVSYSEPILGLRANCHGEDGVQYCTHFPIVIGSRTVTVYTNSSNEAREFAGVFPIVDGRIDLDVTLGSAQAKKLGGILERVLGTKVLNGQLERACTGLFPYDSDVEIPCNDGRVTGLILVHHNAGLRMAIEDFEPTAENERTPVDFQRDLTNPERSVAQNNGLDTIDLSNVRIEHSAIHPEDSAWWVDGVHHYTIFVPSSSTNKDPLQLGPFFEESFTTIKENAVLIHELTHVHQHHAESWSHGGWSTESGHQKYGYRDAQGNLEHSDFEQFSTEEQAEIMADRYRLKNGQQPNFYACNTPGSPCNAPSGVSITQMYEQLDMLANIPDDAD